MSFDINKKSFFLRLDLRVGQKFIIGGGDFQKIRGVKGPKIFAGLRPAKINRNTVIGGRDFQKIMGAKGQNFRRPTAGKKCQLKMLLSYRYACMYVMYVMYACMHVCMYVCISNTLVPK